MNRLKKMRQRFFMPAESNVHLRTLMAWPGVLSCEPSQLSAVRREVAAVVNAISRFEPVTLFADGVDAPEIRSQVNPNVEIATEEVESPWIRDFGPVFVKSSNGSTHGIDFNFNYWGGKFPPRENVCLARNMLLYGKTNRINVQIQAEGGGLEVDGEGTLLATESCIINPNRNAGRSKESVEDELRSILGVEKIIWLRGARDADITDCHVDALARFATTNTVILSRPASWRPQIWTEVYENAKAILVEETNVNGQAIRTIDLPEPEVDNIKSLDGFEAVASYANYYLANGAVIMPHFGDARGDKKCLEILQSLFPDRKVVPVHLNMLPTLGGGIHCITQQVPL